MHLSGRIPARIAVIAALESVVVPEEDHVRVARFEAAVTPRVFDGGITKLRTTANSSGGGHGAHRKAKSNAGHGDARGGGARFPIPTPQLTALIA